MCTTSPTYPTPALTASFLVPDHRGTSTRLESSLELESLSVERPFELRYPVIPQSQSLRQVPHLFLQRGPLGGHLLELNPTLFGRDLHFAKPLCSQTALPGDTLEQCKAFHRGLLSLRKTRFELRSLRGSSFEHFESLGRCSLELAAAPFGLTQSQPQVLQLLITTMNRKFSHRARLRNEVEVRTPSPPRALRAPREVLPAAGQIEALNTASLMSRRWQDFSAPLGRIRHAVAARVVDGAAIGYTIPTTTPTTQMKPDQTPIPAPPKQARGGPRVAVDLTPMLPGGANGGAKIFVLELLRQFNELAHDWHFILLTSSDCHLELAEFDSQHLERRCVVERAPQSSSSIGQKLRGLARQIASRIPPTLAKRAIDAYWALARRQRKTALLEELDVQLLFCPFSAPLYHTKSVPTVCVIYDLQFSTYPQFFGSEERYGRSANFREACRSAAKLVCISEYVRESVVRESSVDPSRVLTIPIQLASRLRASSDTAPDDRVLREHRLSRDRYLLYPANFWQHKNHRLLLTAFAHYVAGQPSSDLCLVCTGEPGDEMESIVRAANLMGLGQRCRFPGFVSEHDFVTLLDQCRALVFPSLFEGFGMPVLEAMEHGKPVTCSNRTSLPEVAGEAALLFDPRVPAEISAAIDRIDRDDELRKQLIERGHERRQAFASPADMAQAYLQVFRQLFDDAVGKPAPGVR